MMGCPYGVASLLRSACYSLVPRKFRFDKSSPWRETGTWPLQIGGGVGIPRSAGGILVLSAGRPLVGGMGVPEGSGRRQAQTGSVLGRRH